jgi:hypothetical protein
MTADPKPADTGRQGGEQPHQAPPVIWVSVVLMIVGLIIVGFGLVFKSIPIGALGIVVGLVGVILAKVKHIMSYTE